MTILELCEPLFQYVCFVNRSARKGVRLTFQQVRSQVEEIFQDLRNRSQKDARLADQFRQLELPLVFFVDSMIAESGLSFADRWHQNRIAYEMGQLAGDERFFDLLDETLERDRSNEANERLAVFYTCLGLGFTGMYAGQPEEIQTRMLRISDRIRRIASLDAGGRICREAYDRTDARNLIEPPAKSLLGIGIVLFGLTVVLFLAIFYLFRQTSYDLRQALDRIVERGGAPAVAEQPVDTEGEESSEPESESDSESE